MKEEKDSYFSHCVYFSSNVLARKLSRLAEEAFASSGLAPSYAFVLMTVNRSPGISPSGLAEELKLKPSTITRFLDKLEERGYLVRVAEGKSVQLFPSNLSKDLNDQLELCWENLFDQYREILGPELTRELSGSLVQANDLMQ